MDCSKMETPLILPQPAGTVENFPGDKHKTQMPSKHNRLKRAKTYKRSEKFTECGNCPSHVTKTPESSVSCIEFTLISREGKQREDAIKTTDEKDNSALPPTSADVCTESLKQEEHNPRTVQNVLQINTVHAKREHGSSDRSLDVNRIGADKEVLSSCLRINKSGRDRLMDQPEVDIGQTENRKCHDTAKTLTLTPRIAQRNTKKEMRSVRRNEFPNEICSQLLEEIQMLNVQFPVHRFFTLLLRKRTAPEEEEGSTLEKEGSDDTSQHSASFVQKKRKQELEEQICDRTYKRHRTNNGIICADKSDCVQSSDALAHSDAKYRNRLSRTKRRRQQTTFCVTESMQKDSVHQDSLPSFVQKEDVLWTDKYQPQQSSEVIGNSASVRQLHSWLKEWKMRADTEERKRRQEEKNESWDCGDFKGDTMSTDHEKKLCNTVLMIGPSGAGKTAAVYACAKELGFKVIEVNSSGLRCGRLLLSQLTEATQSHQVGVQRMKTPKPEIAAPLCDEAHRNSLYKETSRSPSVSRLNRKPQPVKLTHFFKLTCKKTVGKSPDGPECSSIHGKITGVKLQPDRPQSPETGFMDKRQGDEEPTFLSKDPNLAGESKTVPMSLILFEEVDVIFTEDVGFLAAIKTFMSTTKRPIILTTNDPFFGGRLQGHFDEIHFQTPSLQTIRGYLQCLCVVENMRTGPDDMAFLLCQNKGDIRRSILQLQLWVCSGGGSTELQILKNILCGSWIEMENSGSMEILAEKSERLLFYSNIESLFSPPFLCQSSYQHEPINHKTKGEKPIKGVIIQTSTNVHKVKSDRHLSTCKTNTTSCPHFSLNIFSLDQSHKASVPSKQTKHLASERVIQRPDESLLLQHVSYTAKVFDNMSFLDTCLQKTSLTGTGLCKTEPPGWMGATLKDSLLDLPREEEIRQCFENSSQILALVEGLSFYQYQTELTGIWMEAARMKEKLPSGRWEQMICALSLPSNFVPRMCHCQFCEPGGVEKNKEIVSTLISRGKVCCHNNKRALFMEYLPTLRSICRSESIKKQRSFRRSHYLSSLHLPRRILEFLTLDFP